MNKTQSDTEWVVSVVAGTGEPGYSGDGSLAVDARLNNPFDLAIAPDGSLVFSDTFNHCIRRIDASSGVISTICGTGTRGYSGDGGAAMRAQLNEPYGVVIDRSGRVFFADRLNRRVRAVDTAGVVSTLAGDGSGVCSGDGGPAAEAGLVEPNGLALSPDQSRLFIADVAAHRVRVVDLVSGTIETFAGTGEARHDGDAGPATKACVFGARAVAFAPDGSLYVMERQGSCIRRVRNGVIETVAGTGARGYAGDGGDARLAVFDAPKEMAVDPEGNILVVDTENHAIRQIGARSWIVTTIASGLARPHGAAVAADGSVLVGDWDQITESLRPDKKRLAMAWTPPKSLVFIHGGSAAGRRGTRNDQRACRHAIGVGELPPDQPVNARISPATMAGLSNSARWPAPAMMRVVVSPLMPLANTSA
jgi:DNA-binding beta-propeller fold protein YncE